jgi:hypothetical protein
MPGEHPAYGDGLPQLQASCYRKIALLPLVTRWPFLNRFVLMPKPGSVSHRPLIRIVLNLFSDFVQPLALV